MTTLKEALDQLAKGHELDNEQKKLIIDKWQKELGIQLCEDAISRADALKALDYDIKSFEFKSGVGRHMNEIANLLNTIYEIQSDNIKALPPVQPKQIECEDAISREDAMSMILCYGNEIKAEVMDDIKASMIKLPPVQPKIKTGHWIHRSTDDYGGITTWYECSECGRSVEDIYHVYGEYPYCHCGAKMIEPQESEET